MIAPDTRRKLIAVVRLLDSDKPGEVMAALGAARRLLPIGVGLADIIEKGISPAIQLQPSRVPLSRRWQHAARHCDAYPQHFNDRERAFIGDMLVRRDEPTRPQWDWLRNLEARLEAREAA